MGTRGKRLWIYDNICDPPEPRCMLVRVNHSHCGDEWHSTLLNSRLTPAVCGKEALGLMRTLGSPHKPHDDADAGESVCGTVCWRSRPYCTPPFCLRIQPNIYDRLYVNHSLKWKHLHLQEQKCTSPISAKTTYTSSGLIIKLRQWKF